MGPDHHLLQNGRAFLRDFPDAVYAEAIEVAISRVRLEFNLTDQRHHNFFLVILFPPRSLQLC